MSLSVVGLQLSSLFSFFVLLLERSINCRDRQCWQCSSSSRPLSSSLSPTPIIITTTTTTMVKAEPGSSLSSHALSVVVCLSPFYHPQCHHHHFQERQDFLIILNLFPDTRRGRSTRTSAMCASVSTRTQSSPSTTRPRSISIKVN